MSGVGGHGVTVVNDGDGLDQDGAGEVGAGTLLSSIIGIIYVVCFWV